jgi:hypothetical protein
MQNPRPLPNTYWVLPGRFLAGEYPASHAPDLTRQRLDALLSAGLDTFVDLTSAGELQPYVPILLEEADKCRVAAQYHRFAIRDLGVPLPGEMRQALDALDLALAGGRNVYLHCWGGVGRTGTMVGCYLVRHGLSGDDALAQLEAWWRTVPKSAAFPRSPETDGQVEFIRGWQEPSRGLPYLT